MYDCNSYWEIIGIKQKKVSTLIYNSIFCQSIRRLIIVDYGLARKFRQSDGKPIERRKRAGFRGTLRYVSMRVHERREQGPSDDLIALFFTLIEILRGELPWRNEKNDEKMKTAKMDLVIFMSLTHRCTLNVNKIQANQIMTELGKLKNYCHFR